MPLAAEAELERELDRLYSLPLNEFTSARDELAKQARAEGERAIGTRIKELRKPTVSAWLVNQLARENELDVQRLLKAGERLREAQIAAVSGRDAKAFEEARNDEQHALTRLAAAAREIARREGLGPGTVERVTRTLRNAALTEEGRALLKSGRLSEDLEAQGFEALAGIAPRPRQRATRDGRSDRRRAAAEARSRVRELTARKRELARDADAAEREAERAEQRAEELREEATRAREEAETAGDALSEAEAELGRLEQS
jgi:hypothetical protein